MGTRAAGVLLGALGLVVAMLLPASAGAVSVGSVATVDPGLGCNGLGANAFLVQASSSGPSYAVPPGGGLITSWETTFGSPGAPITMILLRPSGPASYTVVGSDAEKLPSPIAANHVSSFGLSPAIPVAPGDLLGIQVPAASQSACDYEAGAGNLFGYGAAGPLVPGETLSRAGEAGYRLNVEATLIQSVDLNLGEALTPATGGPGVALISLTSGGNPGGVAASVTDVVPNGLTVLAAGVSGNGSCAVAGQNVTCSLSPVAHGQAQPVVDVVVSSTAPGSYTNQAIITPVGLPDSNLGNNSASATLTITAPSPPAGCSVISLRGATLQLAEAALKALHCHIGKVKKVASKSVRKGLVVSTTLKPGAVVAANSPVGINVSSGRPKRARHHYVSRRLSSSIRKG